MPLFRFEVGQHFDTASGKTESAARAAFVKKANAHRQVHGQPPIKAADVRTVEEIGDDSEE